MKLTKSRLKQIIKEELQKEGIMDWLSKKEDPHDPQSGPEAEDAYAGVNSCLNMTTEELAEYIKQREDFEKFQEILRRDREESGKDTGLGGHMGFADPTERGFG